MDTFATIEAAFAFAPGVHTDFSDRLEVSLDCPVCIRTMRTVVFTQEPPAAFCTPTRHAFPGLLDAKTVSTEQDRTIVRYRIHYKTAEFVDETDHLPSVRHPAWARISFELTCPRCGALVPESVQNNLRRPLKRPCKCGLLLYEEIEEMPHFRTYARDGALLHEQTMSQTTILLYSLENISSATQALLTQNTRKPWKLIAEEVQAQRPIYTLNSFQNPSRGTANIPDMVFALLRDQADFDVQANGRSLKRFFQWRREQRE